jgi:PAS domain S-box-containing protein
MAQSITIGVLADRGKQHALQTWEPTAAYLTTEIAAHKFTIVPLNFEQFAAAVQEDRVEFILTSPGMYVEYEALYGANCLATLKHLRLGQAYTLFGGVIFCRSDHADIQDLTDLRGKHIMAVAEHSFGGWRMAWREIVETGINPYRDFRSLQFGNSHDAVVRSVQQGDVDVGTISTDVLEHLSLERKVDLNSFRIINQQTQYRQIFPFALSTRLYPEWPFAVARHTPTNLAEQVAIALLKLPDDSPAAKAANSQGWTIPLNYQPVHECFQVLQVEPYQDFGKVASSFELAVKGSNDGLWDWNLETNEVFFSVRWKAMLGYAESEISNQFDEWKNRLHPDDRDRVLTTFQQYFDGEISACELEYRIQHRGEDYCWILCRGTLLRDVTGKPYRMAGSHTDITKRKQSEDELRQSELRFREQALRLQRTLKELQQTQLQLIHSERMSGLGQLVAGVAHEINNPINFVHGNLKHLENYGAILLDLIEKIQQHFSQTPLELQAAIADAELEFLKSDLPDLINSMRLGSDRIRQIVLSLRNFCRLDEAEMKAVDIHEGIDNTLLILQHRLNPKPHHSTIILVKDYGDLPLVECYPGQLNQVFMNILSNAIDSLETLLIHRSEEPSSVNSPLSLIHNQKEEISNSLTLPTPSIGIQTEVLDSNHILIQISDNGIGMAEGVRKRIFDPFFTTKPVGQGTGLGLSISYQILTELHRGKITCESTPGQGTTFRLEIPITQKKRMGRSR